MSLLSVKVVANGGRRGRPNRSPTNTETINNAYVASMGSEKKHERERKENERESLITKKINNSFAITESPSWACSNEINAIWQIVCSCQRAYVIVVSTINQ